MPRPNNTPTTSGVSFFARDGSISFASSNQTYTVYAPGNVTDAFGPETRDPFAPADTIGFAKPNRTGGTARFAISRPTLSGGAFDYSRFAFIDTDGATTSGTQIQTTGYCVLGVPTLSEDIPVDGAVSYVRFAVKGEAYDKRSGSLESYTLGASTATMNIDWATGRFSSSLRLIGTSASGSVRELGTYDVQGSLNRATAALSGSALTTGAGLNVNGGLFGPQGKELGY